MSALAETRVYTRHGRVAHVIWADQRAVCHITPTWPDTWFGTGSQTEYEKAARLPVCKLCRPPIPDPEA